MPLQHFTETHHREAPGSEHRSPWIGTEHTAIVEMKKVHESAAFTDYKQEHSFL